MTRIDDLQILKTLDPATPDAIDPHGPRARTDLHHILATDPTTPTDATNPAQAGVRPRRRRLATRMALGSGLVAAAAVTAVVLPSLVGGDEAFATWTAAPVGMSAKDKASAAASCRDQQKSGSPEFRDELSRSATAISERRGAWTLVVLAGQDGFSALCITDDSTRLFQDYFGSIGKTASADRPTPRGLTATVLGTGSADGNELSVAAGLAGSDVTSLTYTSPTRGKVKATVNGGQFALWLPGNELESASRQGVPLQATYRDGTTTTITLTL
ncbi:hypothetical protein OG394_23430 [Kribbella sp. NBC_01245]|uniref:hypothetical protein n=1 Tax=Kribbella sp. NBC_01245 TaxID=2903578 RepID=UPI002E2A99A5|nr:hypothetical protein [Kribbella sp. NBC_01245]